MKVVNQLANIGLLDTVRGPGGGFMLARDASDISLGDIVRQMEPDMMPANCGECVLRRGCGLKSFLGEAAMAFLAVLDARTLADALEEDATGFF